MIPQSKYILLLVLVSLAAVSAIPPVARALQDKPVLTDDQKKKVNAVNDQLRSAAQSIELAEAARRSADGRVTLINDRSSFDEAGELELRKLEELAEAIRSVTTFNSISSLDTTKTQVEKVKTDLTAARDALPAEADGLPEEIGVARKNANTQIERLTKQSKAHDDTKKKLQDALAAVPDKVKALVDLFPPRIAEIAAIEANADANKLLPALPNNMATVTEVDAQRRVLRARWKEVATALAQAGSENPTKNDAVVAALNSLDTKVNDDVLKKLDPWFTKIEAHTIATSKSVLEILPKLVSDPVMNSPEALTRVSTGSSVHDNLARVIDGWTKLNEQLRGVTISGFDLVKTAEAAKKLGVADRTLNTNLTVVQDGLTGDASQFEADQVSLYYFTDVERIMKMLNSATYQIGGIQGAQERAALERQRLTATELDLAAAVDQVNTAQRRLVTLEEELRQSKAGFNSATDILRKATRNLTGVQRDNTKNEERFNNAKAAADADPTNAQKKLDLDRATEERDRSAARLETAQRRNEDATRERDAAKDRNDVLADEQAGLPTKIQQARDQLEIAQSTVARQRREAFLAAQAESDAFAFARDNRPFWFAPAIASTRDPVHRVLMYAFTDSKTIFLRGKPDDLEVVRDIIARFDSPAPQARLTLWTMEMSSDTSSKGTDNFNKALITIEEELANNRALTTATLSFLRDCLNNRVNEIAAKEWAGFDDKVKNVLGSEQYRVARLYFYQPEVAQRLGFSAKDFHKDQDVAKAVAESTRLLAPDPAGTTTLGETLMILSLGKRTEREAVMKYFLENLKARLVQLQLHDTFTDEDESWRRDDIARFFTSTKRALGLDGSGNEGLSSMQLEIVHAAERLGIQRATQQLKLLLRQINDIEKEDARIAKSLPDATEPELKESLGIKRKQLQAKRGNLVRQVIRLSDWLKERTGLAPNLDLKTLETAKNVNPDDVMELKGFSEAASSLNPLRTANPRVAAADQMLKELIIAVEDDLERIFIQRMLNRLRRKITRDKMGVGVGVMQRTSVLATNRLVARVDPRASAQLAVGEETNLIQSLQQLGQIAVSTQTAGVFGLLGALDKLPREAPPEIYGINTGNLFQVTPIFDPSGQALRFKFDFVGITRIQEPNGTVSRQLPRIERHTVNTEVQLSNLEIREISRFESNSRIGRPTEYQGGLPIIKDIPKVRPYLPLLGWFVRKGGKAAVVQQSLIFGQTTMYPTISDIMDLLTPSITAK